MRPWWDTPTARSYGAQGWAMLIIARCIAHMGWRIPANDRDHLAW
jgi:hypothetical protein